MERLEAREQLESMAAPSARALLAAERPQRPGERKEPVEIPIGVPRA